MIWLDLSKSIFNSVSSCFIRLVLPPFIANFFDFSKKLFSYLALGKHSQNFVCSTLATPFHVYHFFFSRIFRSHDSSLFSFQTTSTVSPHPFSFIHICLNLKGLCRLQSIPSGTIQRVLWPDVVTSRCYTQLSGNKESQSIVAAALSRRSQTVSARDLLAKNTTEGSFGRFWRINEFLIFKLS